MVSKTRYLLILEEFRCKKKKKTKKDKCHSGRNETMTTRFSRKKQIAYIVGLDHSNTKRTGYMQLLLARRVTDVWNSSTSFLMEVLSI